MFYECNAIFQDVGEGAENQFAFLGEFSTLEALEAHFKLPHSQEFIDFLKKNDVAFVTRKFAQA